MTRPDNLFYTRYPVLRSACSETLDGLGDAEFAEVIERAFPGQSADELEINFRNLGRTLGRGLKQVGNVAVRAAPGALSGAMQGATMGAALGPYGMLAGAALGAVGGGAASYMQSRNPQPQQRPQQTPSQQPAPAQTRQPAAAPVAAPPQQPVMAPVARQPMMTAPVQQPAAQQGQVMTAQLLQLLSRPEVIQALLSLTAGAMGRRNIPVGNTNAAPEQILETLNFTLSGGGTGAVQAEIAQIPGGHLFETLLTSSPESTPFGQTLALLDQIDDAPLPVPPGEPTDPYEDEEPEYVQYA